MENETISKVFSEFCGGEHRMSDLDAAIADVVRLTRELTEANLLINRFRELAIEADSELSAIAHGRPPSDKAELLRLSDAFRALYERKNPCPITPPPPPNSPANAGPG